MCVKKVKGPLAIVAVLILVVIVVMIVLFSFRDRQIDLTDDTIKMSEEQGIHYGGTFDEFQYFEEETETETVVDVENMVSEMEREFRENAPGDIIREEDDDKINSMKQEQSKGQESAIIIEGEDGELEFANMIQSDGYSENEVLYETTSMEDAQAVAIQISGTVLSYEYGMATIKINEHVDTLLERLESEGSELILYRKYHIAAP